MFMGEYNHSIDAKGRLIIPSKFREQLGNEFVVTKGLDGCLFVYSNEEWARIEESLREKPLTSKDARKFLRFFLYILRRYDKCWFCGFSLPQSRERIITCFASLFNR